MGLILVVDDDAALRDLIVVFLQQAGYNAQPALGGLDASRRLAHPEGLELLITDMLMPERDGIELIRQSRSVCPDLKIIAMSGGGNVGADLCFRFARGLRVDGFLRKPFRPDELVEIVRSVIGPSQG